MISYFLVLILWAIAYFVALVWLASHTRFLIIGAVGLFALALVPYAYGRHVTDSSWHDSPLMAAFGLPTFLAVIVSLIVLLVGVVALVRRAFQSWRKVR